MSHDSTLPCFTESVLSTHRADLQELKRAFVASEREGLKVRARVGKTLKFLTKAQHSLDPSDRVGERMRSGAKSLNSETAKDFVVRMVTEHGETSVSEMVSRALSSQFVTRSSLRSVMQRAMAEAAREGLLTKVATGTYTVAKKTSSRKGKAAKKSK